MRASPRVVALLLVAALGCGGRVTTSDDRPGAPAVADAGAPGQDAASPVEASSPPAGPLPASILLENFQSAGQPAQHVVAATFLWNACPAAPTTYGPCVYYATPCADSIQAGLKYPSEAAGALTVSGTLSGSTPVPESGELYWLDGDSSLFATGAALGVSAAGATVPPFTSPTVTGPPGVVLTSPTLQTGEPSVTLSFSANKNLFFAWQGGLPGARFLVSFVMRGAPGSEVACSFDAAAGQGSVPEAAFAGLGPNAGDLNMHWGQFTTTTFVAGRWVVDLTAGVGSAVLVSLQ